MIHNLHILFASAVRNTRTKFASKATTAVWQRWVPGAYSLLLLSNCRTLVWYCWLVTLKPCGIAVVMWQSVDTGTLVVDKSIKKIPIKWPASGRPKRSRDKAGSRKRRSGAEVASDAGEPPPAKKTKKRNASAVRFEHAVFWPKPWCDILVQLWCCDVV